MKHKNPNLSKKLAQYGSLAVAVAAVSESNGQVVYTDVDPDFAGSTGDSFAIDFDGDGTDDLIINNNVLNGSYNILTADAEGNNGILGSVGYPGFVFYPYALNTGDMISAGAGTFGGNSYLYNAMNVYGSYGNWINVTDKYLGVEFDLSGDIHYGWVRLDVDGTFEVNFVVKDYAYEATAGIGIEAGDIGTVTDDCDPPTNLVLDDVTETTADLSWDASPTETDGYYWAVMAAGDDPDTDTPVADGSVPTGMTDVQVSGLTAETDYDFYVRTDCGTDGLSGWEGPFSFTTDNEISVVESSIPGLRLYPNPIQETAWIEAEYVINRVTVVDLRGQQVLELTPNSASVQIDLGTLSTGVYVIKVVSGAQQSIYKVAKE